MLFGQNNQLHQDVEELRQDQPEEVDLSGVEDRLDEIESQMDALRKLNTAIDASQNERTAASLMELTELVQDELGYICRQFTAVECLSFPNGAGR